MESAASLGSKLKATDNRLVSATRFFCMYAGEADVAFAQTEKFPVIGLFEQMEILFGFSIVGQWINSPNSRLSVKFRRGVPKLPAS